MSDIILALALHFIHVTTPDGVPLDISVDQIVTLAQTDSSHHEDANCVINTSDGKYRAVRETCKEVEEKLNEVYRNRVIEKQE